MTRADLILALFAALVGLTLAHTTLKATLALPETLAQAEALKGM